MKTGDVVFWKYKGLDSSAVVKCTVTSVTDDRIFLESADGVSLCIKNDDVSHVLTEAPRQECGNRIVDELYKLLSLIEEDEMIALSCSPKITLLDYIRKVENNIQDTIDARESRPEPN